MIRNPAVALGFAVWLIVGVFVGVRSTSIDYAGHDALMAKLARLVAVDDSLQRAVRRWLQLDAKTARWRSDTQN